MKYQSEIIKEIIDTRGHEKSSLHYESECIELWIDENKGSYPKLCDYQSEWLNYINENPLGEFPYETLIDVTKATINNVVPYAYKSAILKGSTKYRDIDTGEILESFEEGRNLELVSVKVPVLSITGKNLFDKNKSTDSYYIDNTGQIVNTDGIFINQRHFVDTERHVYISFSSKVKNPYVRIAEFDNNNNFIKRTLVSSKLSLKLDANTYYFVTSVDCDSHYFIDLQIEFSSTQTPYEPYKSNILTVNEDVTLRSNGNICDELNLLTGQLTQRIDEVGEVLSQEVVKTVDLTVVNQDGENVPLKPIEGTMHLSTSSETINPLFSGEIPVEAITQNLASFIEE